MRGNIHFAAPWLPNVFIPKLYNVVSYAPKIACPTMIIHGSKDNLVPPAQAQSVFKNLKCPKVMRVIDGRGHNDLDRSNRFYYWVINFLKDPLGFISSVADRYPA